MNRLRLGALAVLLCLAAGQTSRPVYGAASPALAILQSELQRNFQVLKKEQTPAYFMSYTMYDTRSSSIVASFGALQRSDEDRSRFATVEVRVGDYHLDNTHPIRGDSRATEPASNQVRHCR